MSALVRHLHAFARETRLTEAEWMAAVRWLTDVGQISDDKREEFILTSDVLGPVDAGRAAEPPLRRGRDARHRARPVPHRGLAGAGLRRGHVRGLPGAPLYVHGTVRSLDGAPIPGAVLDVWQADSDGAYESQLDVDEARLRGKYTAREDGTYCVRTIAPLGYAIPMDGPVGTLISKTDISHYRPAHVHFLLNVPGYEPLITHLFREGAQYLDSDVVFGVKRELVVTFTEREPGPTPDGGHSDVPWCEAAYDFVLQPAA